MTDSTQHTHIIRPSKVSFSWLERQSARLRGAI